MPRWVGEEARGLNHIQDVTSLEKNPSLLELERRPCFYSFHEKLPGSVKEGKVISPKGRGLWVLGLAVSSKEDFRLSQLQPQSHFPLGFMNSAGS